MRLFFALWPAAAARDAFAALAQELALLSGGKPVPPAKIHLTVAFLGDVGEERLPAARLAAEGGRWKAFDVTLDQVGSFRGARVGWAGCREPASGLIELQSGLAGRLVEAGFALDERPYAAHVTLARKIVRPIPPSPTKPVTWRASELALVRSELGKGGYSTLASWILS
jgi:2'-5' RNA ligase